MVLNVFQDINFHYLLLDGNYLQFLDQFETLNVTKPYVRWPTTAIHKYILYYCILYLSTQTYSLAVRVYLPVQ